MKFGDISYNFSIAKVLAILMVVTGHYFGGILWIPTTFGLFVFAFSSGFFTVGKYRYPFKVKDFWYAKIVRLFYPLFVIDVFLFLLFLVRGRSGIFSWQTIPSLIGATGVLNWFGISNPSPFGAGLWFFTVLLLFYLLYPALAALNRKQGVAIMFLLVSLTATTILHYVFPSGINLCITVFGFILGSYSGCYKRYVPAWFVACLLFVSCALLLYFNLVIGYKLLNYILILTSSISIVGYLLNNRLPTFALSHLLRLSGCVIQIYFIHYYLIIRSVHIPSALNYLLSMFVITSVALSLSGLTGLLRWATTRKIRIPGLSGG